MVASSPNSSSSPTDSTSVRRHQKQSLKPPQQLSAQQNDLKSVILSSRFNVDRILGKGAFATVYAAKYNTNRRHHHNNDPSRYKMDSSWMKRHARFQSCSSSNVRRETGSESKTVALKLVNLTRVVQRRKKRIERDENENNGDIVSQEGGGGESQKDSLCLNFKKEEALYDGDNDGDEDEFGTTQLFFSSHKKKKKNSDDDDKESHQQTEFKTVLNMIEREIAVHKSASATNHPNILKILESFSYTCVGGMKDHVVAMVMEYCPHGDLHSYLKVKRDERRKAEETNGRHPPPGSNKLRTLLHEDEARHALAHILRGLAFLHSRGIVHRDIKAGNILIAPLPQNEGRLESDTAGKDHKKQQFTLIDCTLKIGDFGLAVQMAEEDNWDEAQYTLCGTPSCIAPEVALSTQDDDLIKTQRKQQPTSTKKSYRSDDDSIQCAFREEQQNNVQHTSSPHEKKKISDEEKVKRRGHGQPADLWSTGCLLYAMLTGRYPFSAPKSAILVNERGKQNNNEISFKKAARVQETISRVIQGKWSIPSELDLSDPAQELLKQLLSLDPKKRGFARGILSTHVFFKVQIKQPSTPLSMTQDDEKVFGQLAPSAPPPYCGGIQASVSLLGTDGCGNGIVDHGLLQQSEKNLGRSTFPRHLPNYSDEKENNTIGNTNFQQKYHTSYHHFTPKTTLKDVTRNMYDHSGKNISHENMGCTKSVENIINKSNLQGKIDPNSGCIIQSKSNNHHKPLPLHRSSGKKSKHFQKLVNPIDGISRLPYMKRQWAEHSRRNHTQKQNFTIFVLPGSMGLVITCEKDSGTGAWMHIKGDGKLIKMAKMVGTSRNNDLKLPTNELSGQTTTVQDSLISEAFSRYPQKHHISLVPNVHKYPPCHNEAHSFSTSVIHSTMCSHSARSTTSLPTFQDVPQHTMRYKPLGNLLIPKNKPFLALYRKLERFCFKLKEHIPKVILYVHAGNSSDSAHSLDPTTRLPGKIEGLLCKVMLMENEPDPVMEICFVDGIRIRCNTSTGLAKMYPMKDHNIEKNITSFQLFDGKWNVNSVRNPDEIKAIKINTQRVNKMHSSYIKFAHVAVEKCMQVAADCQQQPTPNQNKHADINMKYAFPVTKRLLAAGISCKEWIEITTSQEPDREKNEDYSQNELKARLLEECSSVFSLPSI